MRGHDLTNVSFGLPHAPRIIITFIKPQITSKVMLDLKDKRLNLNMKKKLALLIKIRKIIWQSIFNHIFVCYKFKPLSKFKNQRISISSSLNIVPSMQVCLKSMSREIQFWIYELASTKFRFIEMEWREFGKELNMNLLSTFPFRIQCASNTMHSPFFGLDFIYMQFRRNCVFRLY